jgi:hypothetical protein
MQYVFYCQQLATASHHLQADAAVKEVEQLKIDGDAAPAKPAKQQKAPKEKKEKPAKQEKAQSDGELPSPPCLQRDDVLRRVAGASHS